jgi:hypothetical protein
VNTSHIIPVQDEFPKDAAGGENVEDQNVEDQNILHKKYM